jgi:hypothetical protein
LFETPFSPFSIKIGRDLTSLLRPDKMVAYFTAREPLLEAANHLSRALVGVEAHGVPFTGALTSDGLLSEAADPADAAEPPGPRRQGSWRGWVTARLGGAMAAALQSHAPVSTIQYALDRVSLEGVDTVRWTPPEWFDRTLPLHADN